MIGIEKRSRMMSPTEKNIVAHHESGHALMGYLLKDCSPPIKVSIIPRGVDALGFSQQEPEEKKLYNKNELLSKISVLFGGRAAEKIIFESISLEIACSKLSFVDVVAPAVIISFKQFCLYSSKIVSRVSSSVFY